MDDLDKDLSDLRDVELPPGLMGRVLEDALAVQPMRQPAPELFWRQFGGWRGFGGLALASCAGLWIGFAPPAALPESAQLWLGSIETQEVLAFGWIDEVEQ